MLNLQTTPCDLTSPSTKGFIRPVHHRNKVFHGEGVRTNLPQRPVQHRPQLLADKLGHIGVRHIAAATEGQQDITLGVGGDLFGKLRRRERGHQEVGGRVS